jgi:cytochrome c oxidase cbb3-type subunit II
MNFGPLLFLGIFLTFATAWIGLCFMPAATLRHLHSTQMEGSTLANPRPYTGAEQQGRAVYQREGCVYCHTQQVRGGQYNNDLARGWGARRSHPQDYIYDYPVLLGTMRTGPDLANIAARQANDNWHLTHLYDPQLISPGSNMAPFRHLFVTQKLGERPAPDALKFAYVFVTLAGDTEKVLADLKTAGFSPVAQRGERYLGAFDPAKLEQLTKIAGVQKAEPYVPVGSEIVPTEDARHLVAYLKSLDHSYEVPPAENYGRLK